MGIFRKKHDITDIYGVRSEKNEFTRLPDSPSKRSYSRHYHNYFRGYTEVRRTNEKGRIVIDRFYTKPWIVSELSARNYWLVRLLYAVLTVASAVLYIWAMTQRVSGNSHWVVALPGMPAIICLFLLAVVVVQYITVPRKMTLWDHESSTKRLKRAALATAMIQTLAAIALAGFALVTGLEVGRSLLCAGMDLLAAICAAVMFFVERKVTYTEIPNDCKLPSGEAHMIR